MRARDADAASPRVEAAGLPLGFFSGLPGARPRPARDAGPLRAATRARGESDEPELLAYLRAGLLLHVVRAALPDVLAPRTPPLTRAASLLTDGTWVWRLDLAHYVARAHVRLPVDFLSAVRARAHVPPEVDAGRLTTLRAHWAA
ncbi:hypothetical protein RM574_11975 [Streptomyces sp. DSM 41982]|uniref:Uncharacterized protein n=1 Tax=Streptomyces evansiae TaxID=3075535 RepID=A0ABD5E442_9ACTN|nr:hypothetical protein [Streptomyces sp. DSM 41982]MDT0416209.1 hypothetical protein [Streptomyces sp. DSM 41982]